MTSIIIGILIGVGISLIIFFLIKKLLDRHAQRSFDDLSQKSLSALLPNLMELAKRELASVREEIGKDVGREKGIIKEHLEKFEQNIKEKQEDLRRLEEERNRQFGTISESIKNHQEVTEKLSEKTDNLTKILSNNKLRGNWGERVAEDLLRYAGFLEGVHYLKQTAGSSGTIPDFTLLLPESRKINIDVKFPFANLQTYQEAESGDLKKEYLGRFVQDVKNKIREVTSRAYISEEENTLDFVILFVPSEVVYGFINDNLKDVVDAGFQKKVLITSPSSFYATIRIIMESHRHFAYEKNVREVMVVVGGFIENFHRFQEEFGAFDDYLKKAREMYDRIAETRYKKMSVQIRKIEQIEGAR